MQGSPDPARTEEIALAMGTAARGEPVLPGLPGSRLRYSGHDDCYLHVESADPALPAALLSRLLALLAGSALAGTCPVNVPEPPATIAASLIAARPHWAGGSALQDTVAISLTALAEPWRLSHPLPERANCTVTYHPQQGAWQLAAAARPGHAGRGHAHTGRGRGRRRG